VWHEGDLEGERKQKSGAARGQVSPNRRLLSASILAIGSIWPVTAFTQHPPGSGVKAERVELGRRQVPSPYAKLALRVYNYAPVDREVLARSEKITEAIFAESGIAIVWMDCTPLRGEFPPNPACPYDMGASDLVLRLLPRRMAIRLATPHEPLGFAQQCPEVEPACELTVFYFRVEELAADGHRPELILGHVMAHEVAHVLIGPGHSGDGIMRREWSREELRRMSLGLQLSFTSVQSARLRDAVLRRIKQQIPETLTRSDLAAGQAQAHE